MKKVLFALLVIPVGAFAQLKVASDTTVTGFTHPESVGCDAKNKSLYVSEFGSKLAPLEKDGAGYISTWSWRANSSRRTSCRVKRARS